MAKRIMNASDVQVSLRNGRQVSLTGALSWLDLPSLSVRITKGYRRNFGSIGYTAASLFGIFSNALSAPLAIYYVSPTGSNAADGLTPATALRSIHAAKTKANAGGVRALVSVAAGTPYDRANGFTGTGTAVVATVDIAYIATGGRVVCTCTDSGFAPTADPTNTETFSQSIANATHVIDLTRRTQFGIYSELDVLSTAAIVNKNPNSWVLNGGVANIRRRDSLQPTLSNTRLLRTANSFTETVENVSVYCGGETAADGFDFEGGNNGPIDIKPAIKPVNKVAYVFSNCRMSFGFRAVSVASVHGYVALFDCAMGGAQEDLANVHNYVVNTQTRFITVNCTGFDTGRPNGGGQSNNAWTLHEDVEGLDVAGWYGASRGCTIRNIGTSKAVLAGSRIESDYGDKILSGTVDPMLVRADSTAQIWMDDVDLIGVGQAIPVFAGSSGAGIFYRNMTINPGAYGPGTISPWV